MRINRYLASSGVASRRAAESLVLAGRVSINGVKVRELATTVTPGVDQVEVDGRVVSPPPSYTYWILHKPVGLITTAKDPQGRDTVMSILPAFPRVFPVGRLDQDTSGLLLLTNDGALSHRVMHPRYRIEKEYWAWVEGALKERTLKWLRAGVMLEDAKTAPAKVDVLEDSKNQTRLMITITEGRNRQVRRMMDAVGHPIIELLRARVGPLSLQGLKEGAFRELSKEEVKTLRHLVLNPK